MKTNRRALLQILASIPLVGRFFRPEPKRGFTPSPDPEFNPLAKFNPLAVDEDIYIPVRGSGPYVAKFRFSEDDVMKGQEMDPNEPILRQDYRPKP